MSVSLPEWIKNLKKIQLKKRILKRKWMTEMHIFYSAGTLNMKNKPLFFGINSLPEMLKKDMI